MAQYILSGLDDSLVHPVNPQAILNQAQQYCKRVDAFFYKSYQHFKLVNDILSLYCISKIVASFILLSVQISLQNHLSNTILIVWTISLIPVSIIQFIYYRLMSVQTNKLVSFLRIAQKLDHCQVVKVSELSQGEIPYNIETSVNKDIYDFNSQQTQERDQKKINILAMHIKYESQKLTKAILFTARVSFVFYQILHFLGVYIYFAHSSNTLLHKYLMIVLIIGTYQYLQIYVISIVACIVIPLYGLFQLIKLCFTRINSHKFIKMLQPKSFKPSLLKGQHECRVCMMGYNLQEKIIILPCNQMHHFHSLCIKTWLKLSLTCPLCRQQFSSNIQPDQLNRFLREQN